MYRKLLYLVGCLFLFGLLTNGSLLAQEQPEPAVAVEEGETAVIALTDLGFRGSTLVRGNREVSIPVAIPAHWQLSDSGLLQLELFVRIQQDGVLVSDRFGGQLTVSFNGSQIFTTPIEQSGSLSLTVPIPFEVLADLNDKNSGILQLDLSVPGECGSPTDTLVTVNPDSSVTLPHRLTTPPTDLRLLPFPIQQNSFLPNLATLVIPDAPSTTDLTALYTTAAAFGRMSNRTTFELTRESTLNETQKTTSHLIYVGKTEAFSLFETQPDLLTTQLSGEEGHLEMIVSPFNPEKVMLFVGGNGDSGATLAAQALTYGIVRPSTALNNTAVISDVYFQLPPTRRFTEQFTLGEAGFDLRTLYGPQITSTSYNFQIPPGQVASLEEEATVSLIYSHSDLLDYENSGFNVLVNNQPVGSARLTPETTTLSNLTVTIPSNFLREGGNALTIQAELNPYQTCTSFGRDGTWLNIHPETTLNIPIEPVQAEQAAQLTVNQYPKPFIYDADLHTTLMVIPAEDISSWFAGLQLAFDLGKRAQAEVLTLTTAFADELTAELANDKHLLVVGRATDLPFLATVNEQLPGPFLTDSNRIVSDRLPVAYQLPEGLDLGYAQILPSPYDASATLLLLTGETEIGLQLITEAVIAGRRGLDGDLVVIDPTAVYTTLTPPETEAVDEETEETAVSAVANAPETTATPPTEEPEKAIAAATEKPQVAEEVAATEAGQPAAQTPSYTVDRNVSLVTIGALIFSVLALLGLGFHFFRASNRQIDA